MRYVTEVLDCFIINNEEEVIVEIPNSATVNTNYFFLY